MTISSQIRRYTRLTARFTPRIHNNTNYTLGKNISDDGSNKKSSQRQQYELEQRRRDRQRFPGRRSASTGRCRWRPTPSSTVILRSRLNRLVTFRSQLHRWFFVLGSTRPDRTGLDQTGDTLLSAQPDRLTNECITITHSIATQYLNYGYNIGDCNQKNKQINGQAAKPSLLPDTHYTWLIQPIRELGTYTTPKYIYYPVD